MRWWDRTNGPLFIERDVIVLMDQFGQAHQDSARLSVGLSLEACPNQGAVDDQPSAADVCRSYVLRSSRCALVGA
jgi:hypothetical protein